MINILLIIQAVLSVMFILALFIDNKLYKVSIKKKEIKNKRKKEIEKSKKPKELKWPENLPHPDL